MAKFDTTFNFGANAAKPKKGKKKKTGSAKSNAWRAYVSGGKRKR